MMVMDLQEYVRKVAEEAPPLTDAQIQELARILTPEEQRRAAEKRYIDRMNTLFPVDSFLAQARGAKRVDRRPQYLYRWFDDQGNLLYIGITVDLRRRIKQHERSARWYEGAAMMTVEKFDSREAVARAEREAIVAEKPRYNITYQ
jgi:predicted GIY-YIG superfamily endonuclease